jgi:hypothetical protein|eukprot:COSAG06_NODE_3707_length_4993_cov_331.834083_3_plen_38_part_00
MYGETRDIRWFTSIAMASRVASLLLLSSADDSECGSV